MTHTRIPILLAALCVFAGLAVGMAGGTAVETASAQTSASSAATAVSDSPAAVSDCDLVDIDGDNNTVSVDMSAEAMGDDGVTVRYRCEPTAPTLDHDLIDIDGDNNTVTVVIQAENATLDFSRRGNATTNGGLAVTFNCGAEATDCDGIDIDGHNNSVSLVVQNETDRTIHTFGENESSVSWTGGDQQNESDTANGTDTSGEQPSDSDNGSSSSDAQSDTGSEDERAAETDHSSDEGSRLSEILNILVGSLPVVGVVSVLVLGGVLLEKRTTE